MLDRQHTHNGVAFTVSINARPARMFRWTFTAANGTTGSGETGFGMEAAFRAGKEAAERAIGSG